MSHSADTIAAISTPSGPGAIGILRLSGPRAVRIAQACFKPLGRKALADYPVRFLVLPPYFRFPDYFLALPPCFRFFDCFLTAPPQPWFPGSALPLPPKAWIHAYFPAAPPKASGCFLHPGIPDKL